MDKQERMRNKYNEGIEVNQWDDRLNFLSDNDERRVAVYLRSGNPPSNYGIDSLELREKYYHNLLTDEKQCALVDIYKDYAPSSAYRSEFERMISDCHAGKIDLIIVKNVSRFSRNITEAIKTIKELSELLPPVGVFFENENFYTLDTDSIKQLSLLSHFAKDEPRTKNDHLPWVTYYKDIEREKSMIKRRNRDGAQ